MFRRNIIFLLSILICFSFLFFGCNGEEQKICPKCGENIQNNANFCPNCGFEISEDKNTKSLASGWQLVDSITINVGGVEKNFTSEKNNCFYEHCKISGDEFYNNHTGRNLDYKDDDNKILTIVEVSELTNGATSYSYNEPQLEGYWYHIHKRNETPTLIVSDYCKVVYKETIYTLVYIKIVNDTTIKIKTINGETTYMVISYSVKYIED